MRQFLVVDLYARKTAEFKRPRGSRYQHNEDSGLLFWELSIRFGSSTYDIHVLGPSWIIWDPRILFNFENQCDYVRLVMFKGGDPRGEEFFEAVG